MFCVWLIRMYEGRCGLVLLFLLVYFVILCTDLLSGLKCLLMSLLDSVCGVSGWS